MPGVEFLDSITGTLSDEEQLIVEISGSGDFDFREISCSLGNIVLVPVKIQLPHAFAKRAPLQLCLL